MDPLALGLIALAAVLHAAWNILLKTAGDPLRTATVAWRLARPRCCCRSSRWLVARAVRMRRRGWVVGVVSGGVEVAYFVFLAAAYRRGDLSVVYPLARGTAPLVLVAVGVSSCGERLAPVAGSASRSCSAGLLVVQRPWRFLRGRSDDRAAGFALLTGVMIATYTALDRVGVQLAPAWLYAAILWPVCAVGLLVVARVRPRVAGGRYARHAARWTASAVAGGLLTFAAYLLVRSPLSPGTARRSWRRYASPPSCSPPPAACSSCARRSRRREIRLRLAGSVLVWRAPRCSPSRG